jgi:hypothetical protein
LIVVISTTTFPVTGQEEPLPAIQPKGSLAPLTPSVGRSIVLPAEPVALQVPLPTLEEAARANDYITFDALYRSAVQRGDSMAAFAPLHEIWTYGITDPIGAFYGPDIYERLVRAYPAFASYIAEYRIVDSNGNVFYPTSETRTFLLDRALEGRAPGVQLVEVQRSTPRVELRSTTPGSVWDRVPATSKRSTTSPRRSTAASKRSTAAKRSGTPASSPAGTAASRRRTSPPKARKHVAAVATKREPKAAARDTSAPLSASSAGPAGGDASAPSKTPAPVVEKAPVVAEKPPVVAEKTPVASDTATTTAEAPVVVRAEPAATDTSVPAPQPIATDSNFGGRGILLLVIGLIGVGLLAMMLRAPREVPSSIMQPPDAVPPPGDKPTGPTPVEPLRRPQAAPEPPPPGKNRAGGSHG